MMKIGLLGGSFNPAHQGHVHISKLAVQKLGLNQVWWIPTAQNPLKEKTTTPYKTRLQSCLEITKNHPKIRIKDFEKDSFFTHNLIKKLKAKYPQARFYFIAGADNLEKFHLWKKFFPLIKAIEFVIFSRADFLLKARKTRVFYIYQNALNARNKKLCKVNNVAISKENKLLKTKNKAINSKSFLSLPKFSIFRTKNFNISSSAIRAKQG